MKNIKFNYNLGIKYLRFSIIPKLLITISAIPVLYDMASLTMKIKNAYISKSMVFMFFSFIVFVINWVYTASKLAFIEEEISDKQKKIFNVTAIIEIIALAATLLCINITLSHL